MKLRKTKRIIVAEPEKKLKRLDLNEKQIILRRYLSELPSEEIVFLEDIVGRNLNSPLQTLYRKRGLRFYSPRDVSRVTGFSAKTVEKYSDGYLRLVQREDETPEEFSKRKKSSDRSDAPLVANLPKNTVEENTEDWRIISSRILLFVLMAPTQIRGSKPEVRIIRKALEEASILEAGKSQPIHTNARTTSWEVAEGK